MIEITNLTKQRINQKEIKDLISRILKKEKRKQINLSLVFVGKRRIKELNKRYRHRSRSTDVLSFTYNGSSEIVICLEQVKENAQQYQVSFKNELKKVIIHGLLHCLGYDHEKFEKEARVMRKKEEFYLAF